MTELKRKIELNIILFFSIFALLFAFYVEFILGHKPCNLCLLERIPYVLAIILTILVSIFKKFEKTTFFLFSLIFFIAAFLSFYHLGIEQGFIEELGICSLNKELNSLNKEDLLKELNNNPISCKDVTFWLFGLSLATINTIISIIIAVITFMIFINYEKK